MPEYISPGVYINEVSSGARPISAIGTSTAAFLGTAPLKDNLVGELTWINNWSEFCAKFVVDPQNKQSAPSTNLSHGVYGFFLNGGSRCCVINLGGDEVPLSGKTTRSGLGWLEEIGDVSIVAAPGRTQLRDYEDLIDHCDKMRNRIAILDGPANVADVCQLTKVIGNSPSSTDQPEGLRPPTSPQGHAAFYFPRLVVRDPLSDNATDELITVPPSGHIAGIYARTDATQGVHKAPADEVIRGALELSQNLTRVEQGQLNPVGVNCLRNFSSSGIRVFGARTLAESASEWRYISVRRLTIMVEESIRLATRWVIFEPNDSTLWKSLRRDINAFLTDIWRQGALMGSTPEEAFFVKCDEENNSQVDEARVTIDIGIAPIKPAEFMVFRIGHFTAND